MSESGKLHLTAKNEPFKTEAAAQAAQTRLGVETEMVKFGDGFALKEIGQKPPDATHETRQDAVEERVSDARKTSRPDRNSVLAEARKRRKELGARDPLDAYRIPGMHTYWERDSEIEGGRLLRERLNRGWNFVEIMDGEPTPVYGDVNRGSISDRYVTQPGGNGVTLYLMAIEESLYQEDVKARDAKQDALMEQIRKDAMRPDIEGSGLTWRVTTPKPV